MYRVFRTTSKMMNNVFTVFITDAKLNTHKSNDAVPNVMQSFDWLNHCDHKANTHNKKRKEITRKINGQTRKNVCRYNNMCGKNI